MQINLYDVKDKTRNIATLIEDIRDVADAMRRLGLDNGSLELRMIANDIGGNIDDIDEIVRQYGNMEYQRANEASANILNSALAACELSKRDNDD